MNTDIICRTWAAMPAIEALLMPVALAICYAWLGALHWERMMSRPAPGDDPTSPEALLDAACARRDRRVCAMKLIFITIWPAALLTGAILASIEDRRARRAPKGATVA